MHAVKSILQILFVLRFDPNEMALQMVFRQLRELALQRFCQNVLSRVAEIGCSGESAHQRYLRIFEVINEQNRDMARMFDNPRRSRAWEQLCMIRAAGPTY